VRTHEPTGTLRLAELYAPVAADLQSSQRILADELISDQGHISDLCRHVGQFHGKLVRPALLLLSAKACGAVRHEHRVLAAVVELVHIATLVHDDVLDEADIRRRAATVSRLWGTEQAVLMGDFLYSHAFHLCSSLDSQFAARLIGQTAITVCEGEMMQVANRGNFELTEREYLDIIGRKTAALVETCCHLGARYAGADAAVTQRLRAFGHALGLAFQIADDVLDLIGDESEVGKSLGRDVCERELTVPLIHYLRTASAGHRAALLGWLRGNDPQRHRQIAALLRDSDSIAYAQDIAHEQIAAARAALAELRASPARESLDAMADFTVARRR
jgi:octaprenyl-diphosphate synthase